MTVKELIGRLEDFPEDYPVATDEGEITLAVIREEIYYTEDHGYKDGPVVKLY